MGVFFYLQKQSHPPLCGPPSLTKGRLDRRHDELVEVTPKNIRLRKRILDHSVRMKNFMKDKKQ